MSKEAKTIIKYKCDVCGEECEPIEKISRPISYYMDIVNTLELTISINTPYTSTKADICKKCLIKHLNFWIKENEK